MAHRAGLSAHVLRFLQRRHFNDGSPKRGLNTNIKSKGCNDCALLLNIFSFPPTKQGGQKSSPEDEAEAYLKHAIFAALRVLPDTEPNKKIVGG